MSLKAIEYSFRTVCSHLYDLLYLCSNSSQRSSFTLRRRWFEQLASSLPSNSSKSVLPPFFNDTHRSDGTNCRSFRNASYLISLLSSTMSVSLGNSMVGSSLIRLLPSRRVWSIGSLQYWSPLQSYKWFELSSSTFKQYSLMIGILRTQLFAMLKVYNVGRLLQVKPSMLRMELLLTSSLWSSGKFSFGSSSVSSLADRSNILSIGSRHEDSTSTPLILLVAMLRTCSLGRLSRGSGPLMQFLSRCSFYRLGMLLFCSSAMPVKLFSSRWSKSNSGKFSLGSSPPMRLVRARTRFNCGV